MIIPLYKTIVQSNWNHYEKLYGKIKMGKYNTTKQMGLQFEKKTNTKIIYTKDVQYCPRTDQQVEPSRMCW